MTSYAQYRQALGLNFGSASDKLSALKDTIYNEKIAPFTSKDTMSNLNLTDQLQHLGDLKNTVEGLTGTTSGMLETAGSVMGMRKLINTVKGKMANKTDIADRATEEVGNKVEAVEGDSGNLDSGSSLFGDVDRSSLDPVKLFGSNIEETGDKLARTVKANMGGQSSSTAPTQEVEMTEQTSVADKDPFDISGEPETPDWLKPAFENTDNSLNYGKGALSTQPESKVPVEGLGGEEWSTDVLGSSGGLSDVKDAGTAAADLADAGDGLTEAAIATTEATTEAVGASLDAIPVIGDIIGAVVGIGGAIFGAVEGAKENNLESQETQNDMALVNAKQAVRKGVSSMSFSGASVIPTMSSTGNMPSNAGIF